MKPAYVMVQLVLQVYEALIPVLQWDKWQCYIAGTNYNNL